MGAALWAAAGVVAFFVARIVPLRRPVRWLLEFAVAIAVALAAGVAATLLDFGGWNEADWRPGMFSMLCAVAAVGLTRSLRSLPTPHTTRR